MNKLKTIKIWLIKILKSRITVLVTIFGIFACGSFVKPANAEMVYEFSTAYQYYMLDNHAQDMSDGGKTKKILSMGNFGSGGVSGTFSYDDIVNSAPNNSNDIARQFSSMMATYSTFGYFTNKVQGFESISSNITRILVSVALAPFAILLDVFNMILPTLVKLVAKLNVITLLGSVITNLGYTSELANAIGISKDTIQTIFNSLMTFALVMILLAVAGMFIHGSKRIDQRQAHKLKGRLITLVCLPLVVGGSAYLVQTIGDLSSKAPALDSGFGRYMVDDRAWAYNVNFTPNGKNNSDTGGISTDGKNSYVDLNFDPYTDTGGKRIVDINTYSSLANTAGDNHSLFSNTALDLAYGRGDSFTAQDYINYKGSRESQQLYGGGDGVTYGSYYQYAQNMKDKLGKVDQGLNASTGYNKDRSPDGPYKAALSDYYDEKKGLLVTPQTAWRDRFIYGAKTGGAAMDKYYNESPSQEMISNSVGKAGGASLSDQSMYLVLSTIFDETGGRYYIDAPARGVLKTKASFDSNRSSYFVVSMVGNPILTMLNIMAKPLIQVVVLLAVLTAIFSIGLVEMNRKPLAAFLKGITIGDIEYAQAFIVYAVGLAGTMLLLIGFPNIVIGAINGAGNLVSGALRLGNITPQTPQSSIGFNGTLSLIKMVVAFVFTVLYIKSKSFRAAFIGLFTMPWSWASETGDRYERMANPLGSSISRKQKEALKKNKINQGIDAANEATSLKNVGKLALTAAGEAFPGISKLTKFAAPGLGDEPTESENDSGSDSGTVTDLAQVKRSGMRDRVYQTVQGLQQDDTLPRGQQVQAMDTEKAFDDFNDERTPRNFQVADERLQRLQDSMVADGADPDQIQRVQDARNDLYNLGREYGVVNPDVQADDTVKRSQHVGREQDIDDITTDSTQQGGDTPKDKPNDQNPDSGRVDKSEHDGQPKDVIKPEGTNPSQPDQPRDVTAHVDDQDRVKLDPAARVTPDLTDSNNSKEKRDIVAPLIHGSGLSEAVDDVTAHLGKDEKAKLDPNAKVTDDLDRNNKIIESTHTTNPQAQDQAQSNDQKKTDKVKNESGTSDNDVVESKHLDQQQDFGNSKHSQITNNQFNKNIHNVDNSNHGNEIDSHDVTNGISNNQTANNQTTNNSHYNTQTQNQHINNNSQVSNTTKNITNPIRMQQIRNLNNSLGAANKNEDVVRAINMLKQSNTTNDFRSGLADLKDSLSRLSPQEQSTINKDSVTSSLKDMVKSLEDK